MTVALRHGTRWWMSVGVLLLLGVVPVQAAPRWDVFIQHDVLPDGVDRLTFVDSASGREVAVELRGERYTLAGLGVIYYDSIAKQVGLALPDGSLRPHPFIQPTPTTQRIDWAVSHDQKRIAWTLTFGTLDALTTETIIAGVGGDAPRRVLTDGPRSSIRALPVAFSPDDSLLYMDYQPDALYGLTPYPQYAGLFAVPTQGGDVQMLLGEPSCYCGAGFGATGVLRLRVAADQTGFDLHLIDPIGAVEQIIPGLALPNYTQGGDIVLSPDGAVAAYALGQVRQFGAPDQAVRTVLLLVNLQTRTQQMLTDPISAFVEPLMWTDDNSALLITNRQRDGTWKITLSDQRLVKVSDAMYLGPLLSS